MQRKMKDSYMRKIEFMFFHEQEIREAVIEAREGTFTPPEIRNSSYLPDPTASIVIRSMTPLKSVLVDGSEVRNPEAWLEVIDKTYTWSLHQGKCYYEILKNRYSGGHFRTLCMKLAISEATFYQILGRIRTYAALQAAQRHLVQID